MKHGIVFIRFLLMATLFLVAVSSRDCNAQRNATRKAEKELFGKTGKSKPFNEAKPKGAAGKAMKEQERKAALRKKEDEKNLRELRQQHYDRQSPETKLRMDSNSKKTREDYKAKRQNQKKDQTKPELKKPDQPKPQKQQSKTRKKDPKKQPELKQQKHKARSKMEDPKKQPRLKQHKIKKY